MNVEHVMTHEVIAIKADTTVDIIARLMREHRIGGLPVVDDESRVIGIVTETDLFLKEKGMPFSAVKVPTLFQRWVDPDRLTEIYEDAHRHTAADVMTTAVMCVNVGDSAGHAAKIMMQNNIKRLPVLQEGRLVGIITRSDILHLMAKDER